MACASPLPQSPFRENILQGRVVIVTGGATGIGFACSEMFGKHGCKVAIMSRRGPVIEAAVRKLQGMGIDALGQLAMCGMQLVLRSCGRGRCAFWASDFLINNAAGIMAARRTRRQEGSARCSVLTYRAAST